MWSFVVLQVILLLVITLQDWVDIPPLTNIKELKKVDSFKYRLIGTGINGLFVLIPLALTLSYWGGNWHANLAICCCYGGLTLGTILSWWIPYFFGSSPEQKQAFQKFKNTHHFLPKMRDHVVPNTFHVGLHLLIWASFIMALLMVSPLGT